MDHLLAEVSELLAAIRAEATSDHKKLFELVYPAMLCQARELMSRERAGHTLGPTALVHEALLKLFAPHTLQGMPDAAAFCRAARAFMCYVLVSHARARRAAKRGGGLKRIPLDDALDLFEAEKLDVADLYEAVEQLAHQEERAAQVVTLRFFLGMTMREVADKLGVSLGTVEGDFRLARARLRSFLTDEDN